MRQLGADARAAWREVHIAMGPAHKWRSTVRQVRRHVDRAVPEAPAKPAVVAAVADPSNPFGGNGPGTRAIHSAWIVGRRTFAFLG